MYRLGQWIDATLVDWLPGASWDDCPHSDPPDDGADVILALAGTWTTSIALVGCTLDGATFLAYAEDLVSDDELEERIVDACARWNVVELVVAPRIRPNLVRALSDQIGLDVEVWPRSTDLDVVSSTDWRRAILEGRVAHDHDPVLAAHVSALVGVPTPDGSLRLGPGDDSRPADAGTAARMAWWRVVTTELDHAAPAIY